MVDSLYNLHFTYQSVLGKASTPSYWLSSSNLPLTLTVVCKVLETNAIELFLTGRKQEDMASTAFLDASKCPFGGKFVTRLLDLGIIPVAQSSVKIRRNFADIIKLPS